MRVIVEPAAAEVSRRAAGFVAELVRRRPKCVLGLAADETIAPLYEELVRLHRQQQLDFSRVVAFGVAELVGLPATHPLSQRARLQRQLFERINIDPRNTHLPDGRALDFEAHCQQYEKMIRDEGGIDLQLLVLGSDGHIGFNEPGSSLGSRTRLKMLTAESRDAQRGDADPRDIPRLAVTMGVGTILESRQCLLLATGAAKAEAVRHSVEGPVTAQVTASALQLHRDAIVVVDADAARLLARRQYYREVEQAQAEIQAGQR